MRENSPRIEMPISLEKLPIDEMYPFLNKKLTDYYDEYMQSDSSILLLIGPPGTGKTTFIKGLLAHTNGSAVLSYSPAILEEDSFFVSFLSGNEQFMILEDSDNFIKSRTQGNDMMHRFLNVSDGLVSVKGKKMIFSTNLEDIGEIDQALIRNGRCFDVLQFTHFTSDEAQILADVKNIEDFDKTEKEQYTIADILVPKQNYEMARYNLKKSKIGFV